MKPGYFKYRKKILFSIRNTSRNSTKTYYIHFNVDYDKYNFFLLFCINSQQWIYDIATLFETVYIFDILILHKYSYLTHELGENA